MILGMALFWFALAVASVRGDIAQRWPVLREYAPFLDSAAISTEAIRADTAAPARRVRPYDYMLANSRLKDDEPHPYICLGVSVFNGNVIPIAFLDVSGRLGVQGPPTNELPNKAELLDRDTICDRGDTVRINFRVDVTKEDVERMKCASRHNGQLHIVFRNLQLLVRRADITSAPTQWVQISNGFTFVASDLLTIDEQ